MDVLYACTDESRIALKVLRLNEELDLNTVAKMYTMALEVSSEPVATSFCSWFAFLEGILCQQVSG